MSATEERIKAVMRAEAPELEAEIKRIAKDHGADVMRSMSSYVKVGMADAAQDYFSRLSELRAKASAYPAKAAHYLDLVKDLETEIMLAEADASVIKSWHLTDTRSAFIEFARELVDKVGPIAAKAAQAYIQGEL